MHNAAGFEPTFLNGGSSHVVHANLLHLHLHPVTGQIQRLTLGSSSFLKKCSSVEYFS